MASVEHAKWLTKARDYASRLALMKDEAGRLGLFHTMHAFDEANGPLQRVGWEIQERIEKEQP